jgi:hypothetical protein
MSKIMNFTQHTPTAEQREAGVYDPERIGEIRELLTFDEIPDQEEISYRAMVLANIAARESKKTGAKQVMIGGAPYLMPLLHLYLEKRGLVPVYAFSKRISEETVNPDGTVTKKQIFRHIGFVSYKTMRGVEDD